VARSFRLGIVELAVFFQKITCVKNEYPSKYQQFNLDWFPRIRDRKMSEQESGILTVETVVTPKKHKTPPKRQPRYNVVLWDDDDHSYEYVILMMRQIFGHPFSKGFAIAETVDVSGRSICLTTTREHAELKVEQIHSFGKDFMMKECAGSMSASIEPVPSD
jgi:ATP-dependent Clp protease adaptor protein ClpS